MYKYNAHLEISVHINKSEYAHTDYDTVSQPSTDICK